MRATCVSRQTLNSFGSVANGFTTCLSTRANSCQNVFQEASIMIFVKVRLVYAKQHKHTASSTRKLKRRLLQLLSKLLSQWKYLCKLYSPHINLSVEQEKCLSAVRAVYLQQSDLFSGKEVKHRIVSINHPYLRPHCQRQGKQACGVWGKSQQHTD